MFSEDVFSTEIGKSSLDSLDISSITGKNLLTGQKVTLDSYLGKIKRDLEIPAKKKFSFDNVDRRRLLLNSLLNKKLKFGKIANGKQLVGKIVQIRHQNEQIKTIENTESINQQLG